MLIQLLTEKYPGMRLWLSQRLTAAVMASYTILSVVYWLIKRPESYADWIADVSPWWWRLITWFFFACLCMHAWLGVRDVLRDYVPKRTLRNTLQILVQFLLWIYLLWLSLILWNL